MAVVGDGRMMLPPPLDLKELRTQLQQLRPRDLKVPVEHWIFQGDPATEILAAAEKIKCDLIVMGAHGRTGLGRLLMGSVAEQVVRKAPALC
jgi:nucleotide-binding universal stress UspA family protein